MDIEKYRQQLLSRLESIDRGQAASAEDRKPVELDQTRFGRLSRMDALQQQAMSQASSRMLQQERQRIKAALRRVDDGDFGYCLRCGEEISGKRLDFDPSVPLCLECAEEAESRR